MQYTDFVEGFSMLRIAKSFINDERGEDLIEYGLLAAFVAAIAVAVIIADPLGLKTAVEAAYQAATDALNGV
jgi:Flp pilus assembly pilin Flp